MLKLDHPWAYGSETENCTTTITVPRGTQYNRTSGDSVTIDCPVTYCEEQPVIQWYRYNKADKKSLILQNEQRHTVSWINGNNFILNFSSVNKNDSGLYHCVATVGEQKIESHLIEVFVQDYSNLTEPEDAKNTTENHGAPERNKILIIYFLSSLGALCFLIFCCSGLLFFVRRNQVTNKMISSNVEHEMNVLSSHTNAQCYSASTTHVSDEGFAPGLLQFPDGNTIYDNQGNCQKASKAAQNLTCNESVTCIHQLLPANQDALVYATLSHEEPFQRCEPVVETVFTEYATIRLKK
ncbi:B- and T-lymphocyte attenuator [Elgaria multicarinata webbii]|uniref:B- and T-lymphocyte attenuator n=1 Tax=Elgaria multicarinata webbii TaxID=159646 RepID=UPI002FCCE720